MDQIRSILEIIADWVEIFGVSILIYGFIKFFIKFLVTEFYKTPFRTPVSRLQEIRCEIGVYILLSLDFLIASDIIFSIADLSQEQLIRLSVMILIRTTIGFFLGKEINELEEKKQ